MPVDEAGQELPGVIGVDFLMNRDEFLEMTAEELATRYLKPHFEALKRRLAGSDK